MARIERVELRVLDPARKVLCVNDIESFVGQETAIVAVIDSEGGRGTGYSDTIRTGLVRHAPPRGSSAPRLIGREAEEVKAIWNDVEFIAQATTAGAITAIGLAAVATALWDLRRRGAVLPLWRLSLLRALPHDRGQLVSSPPAGASR